MIRAALIGISGHGRWHLLMLAEQALLGRVRLVAATVINQDAEPGLCARLRAHGVELYADHHTMLAELTGRIDLVLIPTGIHHHAAMALAAFRAGAHVLVEKPIAATLEDADAIATAARAADRLVAIGYQDLYPPFVSELKQRLIDGELGPIRRLVVRAHWPRPVPYFSRNAWAGRLRVGEQWVLDSLVNNACAHFLMLALYWAGSDLDTAAQPTKIEGLLLRTHPIETFDTASVILRGPRSPDIEFHGTHCGVLDLPPEVRVIGERGELTWTYERTVTIRRDGHAPLVVAVPDQLSTRLLVLEKVLERLAGRPAFIVPPELARSHTRVVNALHSGLPIHPLPGIARREIAGEYLVVQDLDRALESSALVGRPLAPTDLPGCPATPDFAEFDAIGSVDSPFAPFQPPTLAMP
jgi:predicted dehydrogenase